MRKKFIGLLIIALLPTMFTGCFEKEEILENKSEKKVETTERSDLKGTWAKDYTREELETLNQEVIEKVKELTESFGLSYEGPKEEIKKEGNDNVNSYFIEVKDTSGEPGTIDSMLYELKKFGSNIEAGQISLKIGYHIDESIIETEGFDLHMTSIGDYSKAVTGNPDRDYTDINKRITDIIKGNSKEDIIENNVDGLLESIMVTKEENGEFYLIYKLESKVYKFNK